MYYKTGDKVEVLKEATGNGEPFPYWKSGTILDHNEFNYIVRYDDGGLREIGREDVSGMFQDDEPLKTLLGHLRPKGDDDATNG